MMEINPTASLYIQILRHHTTGRALATLMPPQSFLPLLSANHSKAYFGVRSIRCLSYKIGATEGLQTRADLEKCLTEAPADYKLKEI